MPTPVVVPDGASTPSTFPTAADIYRDLARNLGMYSGILAVSSTVPSGEPGRWVICDEMQDDEDERAKYAGTYLYVANGTYATTQRRTRREGYEGEYGALALSRVLPANLSAATAVEMTWPLPVRKTGTVLGLLDFANEGLKRIHVDARVTFTGNGTYSQSLSTVPWLTRQDQVDGIFDWAGTYGSPIVPASLSGYEPTIVTNGATVTLETGYLYTSADTFYLRAFPRGDQMIYSATSGAWDGVNGLVNDGDQAAAPLEWIRPVAMVKALEYLPRLVAQQRRSGEITAEDAREILADLPDRLQEWKGYAAKVVRNDLPRPSGKRRTVTLMPSLLVERFQ